MKKYLISGYFETVPSLIFGLDLFNFNLPEAIDAAIIDGPNPIKYLSKRSLYQNRWQGNIRVQSGDLELAVKYEEGVHYKTLLKWVDNDV